MRREDAQCIMRQVDNKETLKEALKEAAREWLDEQFKAFGKWTAVGLMSVAFYGVVKFFVVSGWWPKG
jgi:hypothetical protein